MIKAYVVARYMKGMADWELVAINGILYGKVYIFEPKNYSVSEAEKMIDEFVEEHPDTISWSIDVETVFV